MKELFITILNMSITASCIVGFILVFRLIFGKRFPKLFSYALWGIVLIRLALPFSIESAFSLFTAFHTPAASNSGVVEYIPYNIDLAEQPQIDMGSVVIDSLPPAVPAASVNPMQIVVSFAAVVWIAGAMGLILYYLISYLALMRRLRTATLFKKDKPGIYLSDQIYSPVLFGILKPKIVLPHNIERTCTEREMDLIILHEHIHIKHVDHIIKPLSVLVLCVHWFNPLIGLAFYISNKDRELACDEGVIKQSGDDVRKEYANSLLNLSKYHNNLFGVLAFGESNIKTRIQSIIHFKKPAAWIGAAAAIVLVVVSLLCLTNAKTTSPVVAEDDSTKTTQNSATRTNQNSMTASGYEKVKIEYKSEVVGFKTADEFETTDAKIIGDILSMLEASKTYEGAEPELVKNYINQYVIEIEKGGNVEELTLWYDTLYNKAYVEKEDGLFEIGTDFARYVNSLFENQGISAYPDENAVKLFKEYGWTLDYLITQKLDKLGDLDRLSSFDTNAYYYAYHNELSKDIGLDMDSYSNRDIDVQVYKIRESMPDEFYPIQDARGIVVTSNGRMIGAYISAGRHSTFNACSLKGNRFENVTGMTFNKWLDDKTVPDREEKRLAGLTPEQIIKEYFNALNKKDEKTAVRCLAREEVLDRLSANMPNDVLYNNFAALPLTDSETGSEGKPFSNLKSARVNKIETVNTKDTDGLTQRISVSVDLQYRQVISINSGEQFWDCTMVYETPQTGWKIVEFGH